jgi:hypothetical protein
MSGANGTVRHLFLIRSDRSSANLPSTRTESALRTVLYVPYIPPTTTTSTTKSPTSTLIHVPAHADLPPPGPDHFAARRALWTKHTAASRLGQAPSTSCVRLESLLDEPGALERPDVWDAGLKKVWKGLIGGGRFKNFLPLRAVV